MLAEMGATARLLHEVSRRSLRRYLTYRAATLAGLATNVFFGLVRVAILLALYGEQTEVEGFTVSGVITYTALTQAVIAYLSIFGWWDLMQAVHSGEVAADLLKPMDFLLFWLGQDAGRMLVNLVFRGVSIMLIYGLFLDVVYPEKPLQWLAVALAVCLSWLLSFGFRFLLNMAAFWTPNARGIGRFGYAAAWFFSGFLMPLRFLPEWVQTLAYLTPFPHMINTVVEVYLGVVSGPELVRALAWQLAWAVILLLLCRLALRRGVRRLVLLGG